MKRIHGLLLTSLVAVGCATNPGPIDRLGDLPPIGSQIPWDSDPDIEGFMDRLEEAGVAWARSEIVWWGLCESVPGEYDFDGSRVEGWEHWSAEHWVDGLVSRGIRPYAILAYGNAVIRPNPENPQDWWPPNTPESRESYAAWCGATAAHFADRVDIWEIWNEPNLAHFWGNVPPSAEDYTALCIAAAQRIRAADPDSIIVGGVVSGIDNDYLERCFELGMLEHIDAVSIHPYRTAAPETITRELNRLRALLAEHTPEGKEILIFTGEWGYNTVYTEVSEAGHPKTLLRMMLNNMALGIDLSIWFSSHAFEELDHTQQDSEWGLLNRDLSRRPAFFAMKTLNEYVDENSRVINPEVTYSRDLDDQHLVCLQRGDQVLIAPWLARWPVNAPFEAELVDVTIPAAQNQTIRVIDALNGAAIEVETTRGLTLATLRDFPMQDYPILIIIEPQEENGR